MDKLVFAYDTAPINSIYINGVRKEQHYYKNLKNRTDEYNKEECFLPFKNIIKNTNIPFENRLVSDCIKYNKKFIYLLEILYSNKTWLDPKRYQSFSPWPNISESAKTALLMKGGGTLLITHLKKHTESIENDPVRYELFRKLHIALDKFEIPTNKVACLSPIPELPSLYKKFCKNHRIQTPLKGVYYINYFEKGWGLYFKHYQKLGEIFTCKEAKSAINFIRPYKFLCFNREPRAHRKLNLLWLINNKLLNEGLVSFSTAPDILRFDKENSLPEDKDFQDLMKNEALIKNLTVDIPPGQFHISFSKKKPFADTYFSFLTERVFNSKEWVLLTPKVFKAITNMHPFIVLGQKGYLKALRRLGYKTFHPNIDESYDNISDPVIRTKTVWNEVKKLCSLNLSELHKWHYALLPVLEHNWNVFLKRMNYSEYERFIKTMRKW